MIGKIRSVLYLMAALATVILASEEVEDAKAKAKEEKE